MKKPLTLYFIAVCLYQPSSFAVDSWDVEGLHGQLRVHGMLTEAPCRLDMTSAWQEIDLGETPEYFLRNPGDMGLPVPFKLRLRDCIRTYGTAYDALSFAPTWSEIQPIVSVSFSSSETPFFRGAIQVTGISGLALKIVDKDNLSVRLGEKSEPKFLERPSGELVYYVIPMRTPELLMMGRYRATMDFKVNYE